MVIPTMTLLPADSPFPVNTTVTFPPGLHMHGGGLRSTLQVKPGPANWHAPLLLLTSAVTCSVDTGVNVNAVSGPSPVFSTLSWYWPATTAIVTLALSTRTAAEPGSAKRSPAMAMSGRNSQRLIPIR